MNPQVIFITKQIGMPRHGQKCLKGEGKKYVKFNDK